MKIGITLHCETEKSKCYNFRADITPRYINSVVTVHSRINTHLLVQRISLIRWDLSEYREHFNWVKDAWFDDTVKPPYLMQDYDPIPF